ncbi:hypothetical protein BJX96DRAFT_75242 [Aspergillus floccosus]
MNHRRSIDRPKAVSRIPRTGILWGNAQAPVTLSHFFSLLSFLLSSSISVPWLSTSIPLSNFPPSLVLLCPSFPNHCLSFLPPTVSSRLSRFD